MQMIKSRKTQEYGNLTMTLNLIIARNNGFVKKKLSSLVNSSSKLPFKKN